MQRPLQKQSIAEAHPARFFAEQVKSTFCKPLLLGAAQISEWPQTEEFQDYILMFIYEHLRGFFLRPRTCEAIRTIRDPKSCQRHYRGVAVENVSLHFVESVHRGMVRVLILRRILVEIDAG